MLALIVTVAALVALMVPSFPVAAQENPCPPSSNFIDLSGFEGGTFVCFDNGPFCPAGYDEAPLPPAVPSEAILQCVQADTGGGGGNGGGKNGGGGRDGAELGLAREAEQEADSGDVDQSFTVTGGGDNSNQCAGVSGTSNTGNAQNQIGVIQYGSEADDFEFEEVGSDLSVSPTSTTTCDQQVNQAAAAG